jgi:phosphatidylinositol-3-phosphatase
VTLWKLFDTGINDDHSDITPSMGYIGFFSFIDSELKLKGVEVKNRFAILAVALALGLHLPLQAQASSISMSCTSPTNGGSYTSPMPVQCTATAVGDRVDSPWHIYVDNGAQDIPVTAPVTSTSSINTSVQLSTGQHSVTIRAWQSAGSLFATVTAAVTIGTAPPPPPPPPPPNPNPTTGGHVVIVMEENHTYAETVNPNNMPYLYSLSQKYSNATQYYAETHPSIGNYFELTAGWKITDNDSSTSVFDVDNITKYLQASGKSWKVYAENLPSVGYVGGDTGLYVKHHNPFAYFANVVNSNLKNNIVPFSQFGPDLANGQLPNYSFIIPNQCNNAHDCSLNTADSWLKQNIDPLMHDTLTFGVDGLLMVVMDESDASDTQLGGGHTAAVLAGPKAKQGIQSPVIYKPSSVLRTVCDVLGLNGCPARAQSTLGFNDMHN